AAPTQLYNALGGSDTVVLPSEDSSGSYALSPAVNATWDPTQTFIVGALTDTSFNTDTVTGNGAYNISIVGPATANITISGHGNNIISCGTGSDNLTFNINAGPAPTETITNFQPITNSQPGDKIIINEPNLTLSTFSPDGTQNPGHVFVYSGQNFVAN